MRSPSAMCLHGRRSIVAASGARVGTALRRGERDDRDHPCRGRGWFHPPLIGPPTPAWRYRHGHTHTPKKISAGSVAPPEKFFGWSIERGLLHSPEILALPRRHVTAMHLLGVAKPRWPLAASPGDYREGGGARWSRFPDGEQGLGAARVRAARRPSDQAAPAETAVYRRQVLPPSEQAR
jgi:hypothetical protein